MHIKKILIDAERLKHPFTGLANVSKNLVLGLSQLNSNHLDIHVYGPKAILDKIQSILKIIPYWSAHKFFSVYKSFHLVHVSHQLSTYFRKKEGSQLRVLTLHDLNFLTENLSEKRKKKIQRSVQINVSNADHIVCISEFVKQDLLKNIHLFGSIHERCISVIYNGLCFPSPDRKFDFSKFSSLESGNYILNIGVLFPKKNQKVLLPLLKNNWKKLVLVSSSQKDDYFEEFMNEATYLGVENSVVVLSNISEDDKFALIQNCESMCHPSLYEGFGIPPIEAMYFGKPVFLSRYTSLPEIGGDHAFYFESFESNYMMEFYHQSMKVFQENKITYEHRLREWALRYDYQSMANAYLRLYEQLLGS